jgi:Domain of unknown function (DUF4157)
MLLSLQRSHGNRFVQRLLDASVLQRDCGCGGTCSGCSSKHVAQNGLSRLGDLHRKPALQEESFSAPSVVNEVLSSPGLPLDASARATMEPRFGRDFQHVRIHTDSKASESAKAVSALAYTVGQNIVFAAGQYSPASHEGRRLLAHELAHTVQQAGASPGPISGISQPGDLGEREADRAAETVMRMPDPAPNQRCASEQRDRSVGTPGGPWTRDPYDSSVFEEHRADSQANMSVPRAGLVGGETEAVTDNDDTPMGADFSPRTGAAIGGVAGGLVGAGIGFLVGGPIGAGVGAILGAGVGAALGYLAGGPTLAYNTVTPRAATSCGGYTYAARWGLNGATASTNGFIVQKLQFNLNREICSGGRNDFTKTYWEAWEVRNGNIFVGTSTSPHRADTFQVGPTPGQKGVNLEEGNARFIEGYTEPRSWGRVPEARDLPATTTQPAGWSDFGTVHRSVRVSFDCCSGSDPGAISGDG